ncbi:MAG: TonB-dependent receptor [Pseudomonadota bacterium]
MPGTIHNAPIRASFAVSALSCASVIALSAPAAAQVEDIFVEARRVVESLQETPIAISAFSGETLENRQILSSDDLSNITPGLTFDSVAPSSGSNSAGQIFIRGVGQTDFTGVTDPGVGVYVDGVYMARSIGSVLDFVDIEKVEVLRGPQGTLFGRNTIGGAIVINSARPNMEEFEGEVQVTYGSYDQFFVTGHVNVPITDTLATRFSANRRSRDGYVERISDGIRTGDDDTFGFRGSLLWEPEDNVSLYIVADYSKEDENGAPSVNIGVNDLQAFAGFANIAEPSCPIGIGPPVGRDTMGDPNCANNNSFSGPFTSGGTFDTVSELEAWGVSGEIAWDINEMVSLKSITSYRTFDMFSSRDADNTPLLIFQTQDIFDQEQFSQELVANVTAFDDRLNWIVGLYYFNETGTNENPVDLPVGSLLSGGDFKNTAYAAFTQATFDVTDRLSATFGIRYSEDDKEFTPLSIATSAGLPSLVGVILPNAYAAPGGIAIAPGTQFVDPSTAEASFDDISILASVAYQWTPEIQTYASFSQGYKSGGFDQRYAGTQPEPAVGADENIFNNPISGFDPEELTTYEIGFKSDLFDNRVRLNIAAYFSEYKDLQLIVRETFNPITFNGGDAEIMGFELETTIVPGNGWTIIGSVAYIDGEYTRIDESVAGITIDNELVNTSPWQTSLLMAYEADTPWGPVTTQMDWSYRGAQFNNAINTPQLRQDPYHLVNVSVSWQSEDERYGLTASVNNLTDSDYLITGNSAFETAASYIEGIFGRPRTYAITGEVRF